MARFDVYTKEGLKLISVKASTEKRAFQMVSRTFGSDIVIKEKK